MDIYRIIGNATLLTVAWLLFAINGHSFTHESAPRANIVPSRVMEVDGQKVDVPMPDPETMRKADMSLIFMTEDAFQRKMGEYRRAHMSHGVLAVVFGIAVFVIGARLGEHWGYGVACVLFGPLAVAYTGYRRSQFT
jgi:hypothetical protein